MEKWITTAHVCVYILHHHVQRMPNNYNKLKCSMPASQINPNPVLAGKDGITCRRLRYEGHGVSHSLGLREGRTRMMPLPRVEHC